MPQRASFALLFLFCGFLPGQVTRPKDVREIAKGGPNAIPQLQPLLKNPDRDIRTEAVKSIVTIGTQRSLDPLIEATADSEARIQVLATDGLVNFYLPGYVKSGLGAKFALAAGMQSLKPDDRRSVGLINARRSQLQSIRAGS